MDIDRHVVISRINIALNAREADFEADAPIGKAVLAIDMWIVALAAERTALKQAAARCLVDEDIDYHQALNDVRVRLNEIKQMIGNN